MSFIHCSSTFKLTPSITITSLHFYRDLHSYLLGEQDDDANQPVNNNNNNPPPGHHNNNNNPAPAVGEGLHAAHQAILQQGGPVGFQPYHRPLRFPFRVRPSVFEWSIWSSEKSTFVSMPTSSQMSFYMVSCSKHNMPINYKDTSPQ